jgi:2-isopropylmalate synthase
MDQSQSDQRVEIYDTTLRDGTQGEGVSFSLIDKIKIARQLDALGVDYIEGGYPLSNPKDVAFFEQARQLDLRHAKICAFGMTRRRDTRPADDIGMQALVNAGAPVITIVGKTWSLHVDEVLRVSRQENLDMIGQSIEYCSSTPGPTGRPAEVFYDAEHFFDGFRDDPEYALQTLRAAVAGGATRLVLCDTNGGSLPNWVADAVDRVRQALGHDVKLGVHTHNDAGLAVANSLAAVEHGCAQVQGTINGIGERCGNVDLTTVAANLRLKMNRSCLDRDDKTLQRLTETSRYVYELANMNLRENQPYVGSAAFAHKGGMHVHAVNRLASSYEHVPPESVGNSRRVLISELAGVSNVTALVGGRFDISGDRDLQRRVLQRVQDLENAGYQFEAARASFELLLRAELGQRRDYWELDHYRCVILKTDNESPVTEAIVKLRVDGQVEHQVAEGDGPVNALDGALRRCLERHYPQLHDIHLRDYKVRVVNATEETAARVRVVIDLAVANPDGADRYFSTVGVSENIVEASWQALIDAFEWYLLECEAPALTG